MYWNISYVQSNNTAWFHLVLIDVRRSWAITLTQFSHLLVTEAYNILNASEIAEASTPFDQPALVIDVSEHVRYSSPRAILLVR